MNSVGTRHCTPQSLSVRGFLRTCHSISHHTYHQSKALHPSPCTLFKASNRIARNSKRLGYPSIRVSSSSTTPPTRDVQILWFKHDLRIDDHPGLHLALNSYKSSTNNKIDATIIPLFCFDPFRYEQLVQSSSAAAALSRALSSLQSSLQSLGLDLIVAIGAWEEEIPRLVHATNATRIICEQELEQPFYQGTMLALDTIRDRDRDQSNNNVVEIHQWSTPLFNTYATDNFPEWQRQRGGEYNLPLDPPKPLPSSSPYSNNDQSSKINDNDNGESNTLENRTSSRTCPLDPREILQQVERVRHETTDPRLHALILPPSSSPLSSQSSSHLSSVSMDDSDGGGLVQSIIDRSLTDAPTTSETMADIEMGKDQGWRMKNGHLHADWGTELAAELAGGGEGTVINALQSYLKYVETSADGGGSEWQWKLGTAIAKFDLPNTPDGCFPAIFSRALALGVVSRRRIYAEAMNKLQVLQQQEDIPEPANGSGVLVRVLAMLGWLLTSSGGSVARKNKRRKAKAAADAAEAGDFHTEMARKRNGLQVHGGAELHHWRWRGILVDYLVAAPPEEKVLLGRPAVLLTHGFGAFSEHWRDNVAILASKGFHVYAPTLPGYGRAEKPSVPYGQGLWTEFLADFVLHVVRKPVSVAGNSIGGFISASMAADYPGAVDTLVLVNSAGQLNENYRLPTHPPPTPSPPLFIVNGVSRALYAFLQGDIEKQLSRVYPVVPERADSWLAGEISRSSADPGALGVFRSVFYLPKPRALNFLVSEMFGGPVLVLQGAKDPLNDAVGRASEIDRLCPNARVVLLNAGHCPFDEVPEQFNEELSKFLLQHVDGSS